MWCSFCSTYSTGSFQNALGGLVAPRAAYLESQGTLPYGWRRKRRPSKGWYRVPLVQQIGITLPHMDNFSQVGSSPSEDEKTESGISGGYLDTPTAKCGILGLTTALQPPPQTWLSVCPTVVRTLMHGLAFAAHVRGLRHITRPAFRGRNFLPRLGGAAGTPGNAIPDKHLTTH